MTDQPSKRSRRRPSPKELANLKRGNYGKGPIYKTMPAHWEEFCIHLKFNATVADAARAAGFSPAWGLRLRNNPMIVARMKEIDDEYLQETLRKIRRKQQVTEEFLDDHLVNVVKQNKSPHAKVHGIELGYKKIGVIQDKSMIVNAQANAQTGVILPSGTTSFEVYEAAWLTRRKQQWSKQLEEKHASNPAE